MPKVKRKDNLLKNKVYTKLNFFQILGWAFYLASSWTWCIGMFLPVLLIRDYGALGWVIFAIPNILGATAMAYVLAKPEMSKELVERHKMACIMFSIVTVVFQIYFIGWVSTILPRVFIILAIFILLFIYILGLKVDSKQTFTASIIWILSLVCFILIFYLVPLEKIDLFKDGNLYNNTNALLYLAPVCFFGFLLCPYLDLTFHKARQSNTSLNSKIIFTLGFCFMFLIMLIFTFFYSGPMANVIEGIPYFLKNHKLLPLAYIYVVGFHMLIQAGFTIILHIRSVSQIYEINNKANLLLLILCIVIYFLPIMLNRNFIFLGMSMNEAIYRSFMAFYSLIAPAYVFLFMISKNKKSVSLDKHNLLVWLIAVFFALPFYAVAFLGVKWNLEISVLLGLAIIVSFKALTCSKQKD